MVFGLVAVAGLYFAGRDAWWIMCALQDAAPPFHTAEYSTIDGAVVRLIGDVLMIFLAADAASRAHVA